MYCFVNSY